MTPPERCTARDAESLASSEATALEFLKGLFAADWKQCPRDATWHTPLGPRCDAHAVQLFEASSRDDTIIGIVTGVREARGEAVNRNAMREASKRIEPLVKS